MFLTLWTAIRGPVWKKTFQTPSVCLVEVELSQSCHLQLQDLTLLTCLNPGPPYQGGHYTSKAQQPPSKRRGVNRKEDLVDEALSQGLHDLLQSWMIKEELAKNPEIHVGLRDSDRNKLTLCPKAVAKLKLQQLLLEVLLNPTLHNHLIEPVYVPAIVVTCHTILCFTIPCYSMLYYTILCYTMLYYAILCMLYYSLLCYSIFYYAILFFTMLHYALLCYTILG